MILLNEDLFLLGRGVGRRSQRTWEGGKVLQDYHDVGISCMTQPV